MDPITQGTVGAAFAQSAANKNNIFRIGLIGFLAGLAPDLDVVIRSSTDPILFLEYHRQFSHSLFFIPFGSLIVALLIFPLLIIEVEASKIKGIFPVGTPKQIGLVPNKDFLAP